MKNSRLQVAVMALLLAVVSGLHAEVKLPAFFSDGMVMQQKTNANLWGTATPLSKVKINVSWNKKNYVVNADNQGNWHISIITPIAGGPYILTFNDGEITRLSNVMMGELWICSGQSNMEMPMKGFKNQPVDNATMDILHGADNDFRLFTVKRNSSLAPLFDVTGCWSEATPASVREFSATAYYFGRELRQILHVPVGLIVVAWGGSACEAWMQPDWLRAFPDAKIPQKEEDIKSKNRTPTVLYNGMLHPLIGMAMRGVIWYQGEDNYNRWQTYADMFTALINGWRNEWNQGDFPFYYCQIAPYDYGLITAPGESVINSAYLREAQSKVELHVKNSGMAVLLDAGLEAGIHPRKKQMAGERLALLALTKTYGITGVTSESPYFKNAEFDNDTVIVGFERADMWISGKNDFTSKLFEVAGSDKVFHPAKAWIVRSKVYVKSYEVVHPVAVRYAFHNYVDGDLFCDGLPVSSFRSDNW
jgi:sialate O-acetylesterase